MTFFPADRLRAVVVRGMVSLCAAAHYVAVDGSGRLLARQRHQGPVPWSQRLQGPRALVKQEGTRAFGPGHLPGLPLVLLLGAG